MLEQLPIELVEQAINHLPVEITIVDADDTVRYYSHGNKRIFRRTPSVIGKKVQNCHPPKSIHVVQKILDDFKARKRDSAKFWINLNDRLIYIRYFAIRDDLNNYKGTLEVTQDITDLKQIKGEKRLLD